MDLGAPDRARPAGGSLEAGVSPQAGRPAPGSWVPAFIARELVLGPSCAPLRHAGRDRPFPGASPSTASGGQPCRRPLLQAAHPLDRKRIHVVNCMPVTASGGHVTPSVRRPRLPVVGASSRVGENRREGVSFTRSPRRPQDRRKAQGRGPGRPQSLSSLYMASIASL